MSTNSDNNIRRSTRLTGRKRQSKINYKELEEGKEYFSDDAIEETKAHQEYEEQVNKIKK